jgi:ankyrin repeat protein
MWFWTLWKINIKVLSTHGANLGQVDQQGDSALYWAARQGHHPVVK